MAAAPPPGAAQPLAVFQDLRDQGWLWSPFKELRPATANELRCPLYLSHSDVLPKIYIYIIFSWWEEKALYLSGTPFDLRPNVQGAASG